MRPDVAKRLVDALAACRAIAQFTVGTTFDQYSASALLRSAVERQFEIVGEALSRAAAADSSLTARLPELPRVVGLRNRIIHGYDSVDDEIIWDVVQTYVAPLGERLAELLREAGVEI